jgi:hypothetical protein
LSSWQKLVLHCATNEFVVGYDLINEPSTDADKVAHWLNVTSIGVEDIVRKYKDMVGL